MIKPFIPVDVVGEQIHFIELLHHPEMRQHLMRLFPDAKWGSTGGGRAT